MAQILTRLSWADGYGDMSLNYLMPKLENGLEILFTGKSSGQYGKTAFILCDSHAEFAATLFPSTNAVT